MLVTTPPWLIRMMPVIELTLADALFIVVMKVAVVSRASGADFAAAGFGGVVGVPADVASAQPATPNMMAMATATARERIVTDFPPPRTPPVGGS